MTRKGKDSKAVEAYIEKCTGRDGVLRCEAAFYMPILLLQQIGVSWHPDVKADDVHHIAKGGAARVDHETNIILVNHSIHMNFLERYTIAGRVLCQWIKWRKGELDVEVMNDIMLGCFPTILETDNHREKCSVWPFIERMRLELVEALCDDKQ